MGARIVDQWAVLGPYDFVTVIEAPDELTVAQIAVEIGARGSTKIQSLPAIPVSDFLSALSESRGHYSGRRLARDRAPCVEVRALRADARALRVPSRDPLSFSACSMCGVRPHGSRFRGQTPHMEGARMRAEMARGCWYPPLGSGRIDF